MEFRERKARPVSDHFSGPRALAGPPISDDVDRATVPASEVFPYLVSPNPGGPQLGELAKLVRPQDEAPKGGRP
jgi:hypothetical protein